MDNKPIWKCVFCGAETDKPAQVGTGVQCMNCGHAMKPVEPAKIH